MVSGKTAAQVAQMRPDAVHTSYVVSVVWMDPSLLTFALHPGAQVPGAVPGALRSLGGRFAMRVSNERADPTIGLTIRTRPGSTRAGPR